jgi:hypothetical protein
MMQGSLDIDSKLYFYDASDKEHVGKIVERHDIKIGKKIETYAIVLLNGKRIRVDEVGWRQYDCKGFEDVTDFALSPLRKGAIVHVDYDEYGVVYEAEVLSLHSMMFVGMVLVRWRKLIKATRKHHAYENADKNYTQAVPLSVIKIIRNGKGIRLLRTTPDESWPFKRKK